MSSSFGRAFRTASPVNNFCLVDLVSGGVGGRQTRRRSNRTVDVNDASADPANEMVVVIADPALEPRGRARGLNPPDETLNGQQRQRVVDGLQGDGTELAARGLGDAVGSGMRLRANRPKDGDPLRGHLYAARAQLLGGIGKQRDRLYQILE